MAHASRASRTSGARRMTGPLRKVTAAQRMSALLAVVYGLWTSGIRRDAGPITTGNVLFGVVCGVVVGVVCYGVHLLAPRLPKEPRAALWSVFAGVAFGFVYSLTDATILRSVLMSLAVAAGVFVTTYYHYATSASGTPRTPRAPTAPGTPDTRDTPGERRSTG